MRQVKNLNQNKNAGFTLLEILTVIGIIAMIASFVMLMLSQQQDKAKQTKEDADLKQIATAIQLMESDTGKWPGGCPPRQTNAPKIYLDSQAAGINTRPAPGATSGDPNCVWSLTEVANWNGPYITQSVLQDPWHTSYVFDASYCDDTATLRVAILSLGKNQVMNYRNASCSNLATYPLGTDDEVKYLY